MPTKFDFVSPGVELREVDQSVIQPIPPEDGLLVIGTSRKGPAMKPVKFNDYQSFEEIFGAAMNGRAGGDPWRDGQYGAVSHAVYAAEAYLKSNVNKPLTFIRLAGLNDGLNKAGWKLDQADTTTVADYTGPLGLFVAEKPSGTTIVSEASASVQISGGDLPVQADETLEVQYFGGSITIRFYDSTSVGVGDWATIGDSTEYGIDINSIDPADAGDVNESFANATLNADGVTGIDASGVLTAAYNAVDVLTMFTQVGAGQNGNGLTVTPTGFSLAGAPVTFAGGDTITDTGNGTLAAIFYANEMTIGLSGSTPNGSVLPFATETFITTSSRNLTVGLSGSSGLEHVTFDFSDSGNGIRSQFNTNASLIGEGVTMHNGKNFKYFLGESFEGAVNSLASGDFNAWICRLGPTNHANFEQELAPAQSGWFIGEKPNQKKLFRLIALEEGDQFQREHYATISNIVLPTAISTPRATFTVSIWKIGESSPLEQFICDLDPFSENFVGKKIGDLNQTWNDSTGRMDLSGDYPNVSSYVRVEVAENVNQNDFPVGFAGPGLPETFILSGSQAVGQLEWIEGGEGLLPGGQTDALISGSSNVEFTASVSYPTHQLSVEGTKGYVGGKDYKATDYLGLSWKAQKGLEDIGDYGTLKTVLAGDLHLGYADNLTGSSYLFSLDDVVSNGNGQWYFEEGSYGLGTSYSSLSGGVGNLIEDEGVMRFAAPFFGGFHGNNIRNKNPYNSSQVALNGYAKHTVEQAIDMVASKDLANFELISMPSITNNDLNERLIETVETRGDALALVDLVGIYESATDNDGSTELTQSLSGIVQTINDIGYNSSYAAAYYPNVVINDGVAVTVPPSVAGIYAIATSEASSQPWFAPAGFNRGGVSNFKGARAKEILNKNDRDTLFLANINPIARFPATGDTVIFGQKTLQQTASALDRINVRRLMIYLKKKIGVIADTILFDQNVRSTWDRFKSQAEPILSGVQAEFGITEYKLVLDETTTTPDLQDRNIMYAKIYVKPARAIEFIAIDFVVTRSGVEF